MIPDITDELYDIDSKHLYMTTEEKKALAKIFASWSHKERVCYIAHVVESKSMQNIAKDLYVSKSMVQTHINRAKKKVLELVG
ncbi:sigma factor-like helix-turn-helix DNA-binding protein [Viridibacillus sp. FSL H8-0123]|uniref:sigma factor-like helix-turn-helix DNA-binding protein n=1 Tax=Viridibacillus sp. FSL H8-0123 TaxID=1928922 RepID=UPI0009FA2771|nr:sigma factor-like helix-turn-helix DNA-binding protein [Viridibacillus sp. FSL H8-0123]